MILLIQFRTDQSGWHEVKSIYEAGGLNHNELTILNAGNQSVTATDIMKFAQKANLVLMGGVGESGYEADSSSAKARFQQMQDKMVPVITQLAEDGIPTLGLCFGHQLIAHTLGGTVKQSNQYAETGVAEICLTAAGRQDQLLQHMDDCFSAIVGHKVSVTSLPDNCTLLARSKTCPIQAFRFKDTMYGFQFHPELDKQALQERLEMYPEYKTNQIESNDHPVTANKIMKQAIDEFL